MEMYANSLFLIQVLGVSPIEGFDMIKAAYTKKLKDAERRGDAAAASQVCLNFILSCNQNIIIYLLYFWLLLINNVSAGKSI